MDNAAQKRHAEFRALVQMLPGKTVTARLMEVCAMLGCEMNTAQQWHCGSNRVITEKNLTLLKKLMRYRKMLAD